MDRGPNCNHGHIVPIFANNKKKRLRQALYANPTKAEQTEDFKDLSTVTSLNSHNEWNEGDDCFETNYTGPQNKGFPRPQKSNSVIKVGNINDSLPSVGFSSRQSHYSLNGFDCIGYNRKGLQIPTRLPVKQESQHHRNYGVDSVRPNSTSYDYNDVRSLQTRNQNKPKQSRSDDACISPQMSLESTKQDQCHQSKEKSSKQLNLMASPTDKSFKVITATIQSILMWEHYKDNVTLLYEIFGILDSQVSLNVAGNGKTFVIKDKTGQLRCTFWEMDRQLPRLTRGEMHRCVGSLDRRTGNFNCVSVRPARQTELQAMVVFLQASQLTMQQQLAALKED